MTAVTEKSRAAGGAAESVVGKQLARELVGQARAQGLDLAGPDGLRRVTKLVLEGALEGELTRPPRLRQARPGRQGRRELP